MWLINADKTFISKSILSHAQDLNQSNARAHFLFWYPPDFRISIRHLENTRLHWRGLAAGGTQSARRNRAAPKQTQENHTNKVFTIRARISRRHAKEKNAIYDGRKRAPLLYKSRTHASRSRTHQHTSSKGLKLSISIE